MAHKVYLIENLCCANCAAKIEEKLNAMPEVEQAVIAFPTRQLRVMAEDPDTLLEKLTQIAQTVEADVVFKPREEHHHHEGCGCGHDHHEHHHDTCGCGHDHHHHHHEGCS